MALVVGGAFALGAAAGSAVAFAVARRRRQHARLAPRPHPSWVPGAPQPPPYGTGAPMITLDPAAVDKPSMYAFIISAVVPRPIAFVSTLAADGTGNLAPYSYFNAMHHNPPVVALGICRSPARGGGKKDSLLNIEETGEFVVNIISDWYVEAANHACGEFDRGADEFDLSGLTRAPSAAVAPPRVAEAAVQLECRLRHIHEVDDRDGNPAAAVVIGEVVLIHVAEAVTGRSPSGKLVVDPKKLAPVARLGGVTYAGLGDMFDIGRPNKDGSYGEVFKR